MSQKSSSGDKDAPFETKDDALGFDTKRDKQADEGGVQRPQGFDGQHKQSSV